MFGLLSVQNTISGGYYRDISENSHSTLYYNMRLNQVGENGSELYVDLGLNNSFVQDEWGTYPYQVYYSMVFGDGFIDAPEYKSRVQVGRTFLTEAFYADIFDGVYSNYYLNSKTWITMFGGGLHVPEEMKTDFDNTLYGVLLTNRFQDGVITKVGPLYERGETKNRVLAHFAVMAPFEQLPLEPIFIVKDQFDFEDSSNDQFLTEVEFVKDSFNFDLFFSEMNPSSVLLRKRREIYEIISISKQKNLGASIDLHGPVDLSFRANKVSYKSIRGEEDGKEFEASANYRVRNFSFSPYIMYTDSFGGTVVDFGIESSYKYNDAVKLLANGSIAKIDKVSGIEGYALHVRGGVDYQIKRYWTTLLALEGERNYRFDMDARAVVYLTHYYY